MSTLFTGIIIPQYSGPDLKGVAGKHEFNLRFGTLDNIYPVPGFMICERPQVLTSPPLRKQDSEFA